MNRDVALWLYALAGPVVWFLSLEANFALAPLAPQGKPALFVISLAALAITAAAGYFSWADWRELARNEPGTPVDTSRRALSLGGVVLSVMFFLTILAQAIPTIFMGGGE